MVEIFQPRGKIYSGGQFPFSIPSLSLYNKYKALYAVGFFYRDRKILMVHPSSGINCRLHSTAYFAILLFNEYVVSG